MTDDATPFALVVRFTVRPEAEASFDDLTARTARLIRVRVFYELYRDREAFGAHEEQDHVRAFLAEREPMLEATEVTFMGLMDGKVPLELPR
jgi:hypothetical protein